MSNALAVDVVTPLVREQNKNTGKFSKLFAPAIAAGAVMLATGLKAHSTENSENNGLSYPVDPESTGSLTPLQTTEDLLANLGEGNSAIDEIFSAFSGSGAGEKIEFADAADNWKSQLGFLDQFQQQNGLPDNIVTNSLGVDDPSQSGSSIELSALTSFDDAPAPVSGGGGIALRGANGRDGIDGVDGVNGIDGRNGIDGADGQDGVNGIDGVDGTDGMDGQDGEDGNTTIIIIDTSNGGGTGIPDPFSIAPGGDTLLNGGLNGFDSVHSDTFPDELLDFLNHGDGLPLPSGTPQEFLPLLSQIQPANDQNPGAGEDTVDLLPITDLPDFIPEQTDFLFG